MEHKILKILELRINKLKMLAEKGHLTDPQQQEYKNLCEKASKLKAHMAKIELVHNQILKNLFELQILK
jgi:hypothetical protein